MYLFQFSMENPFKEHANQILQLMDAHTELTKAFIADPRITSRLKTLEQREKEIATALPAVKY